MSNFESRLDGRSPEVADKSMKIGEKRSRYVANAIKRTLQYFEKYETEIQYDEKHGNGLVETDVYDHGDATLIFSNASETFESRVEFQTAPGIPEDRPVNSQSWNAAQAKIHVLERCVRQSTPVIFSYIHPGIEYEGQVDLRILILSPVQIQSILDAVNKKRKQRLKHRNDCFVGSWPAYKVRVDKAIDYEASVFNLPFDPSKMNDADQKLLEQAIESLKLYGKLL